MRTPDPGWFSVIRGAYGLALLDVPVPLIRLTGRPSDGRARGATRVLGARQLAQATLTVPQPSAMTLALGVEADLIHALSMLGLAVLDRRRRRLGYTNATVAVAFAAVGALLARQIRAVPAPVGAAPASTRVGHLLACAVQLRETVAARVAVLTVPPPVRRGLSTDHAQPARPVSSARSGRAS